MVMSREERRKELDNQWLNQRSREAHAADLKNNAAPRPFFPRKKDDQHPNSKAFQKKWGI